MLQFYRLVISLAFLLLFSLPAFGQDEKGYENLSVSYERLTTEYTSSNTPDLQADLTTVSYLGSEKDWTTTINFSYLPDQNTQESGTYTVDQNSWSASVEVLKKFDLGNGFYVGPKANYAYTETESTETSASVTSDLQSHADSLAGMATIGYSINKNSDVTVNYTFRDDFLTTNEDNQRPISADLLYTLSNNYSLHFSVGTVTEKPDDTKETYNVSVGFGSTY